MKMAKWESKPNCRKGQRVNVNQLRGQGSWESMQRTLQSTRATQSNAHCSAPDEFTMRRCGPSDASFSYFLRGGRHSDVL